MLLMALELKFTQVNLKKGLDLLAKGKKVDYEGATGVTFTDVGEARWFFLRERSKKMENLKLKNKDS